jgi:cytochrome c556
MAFLPAAAFAAAACATAPGPAQAPGITPEEVVAARKAAFHLTGAAMGNMRSVIEGGGDVSSQAYGARGVARWARALPGMFPDSTRLVPATRARPEIWANRADFAAKASNLAAAAERLAVLAEAKDRAGFAAQHKATAAACAACHDVYRVPQQPGA